MSTTPKEPAPQNTTESGKPAKVFRGNGVSVSVFRNTVDTDRGPVVYYKTTVQRIFRLANQFKATHSLDADDVLVSAILMANAWTWINQQKQAVARDKETAA